MAANRPISLVRCPQGRGQEMLLPEARHRHLRRACQARRRSARRTATIEDYLYVDDAAGCSPASRWGRSNSTAGAAAVDEVENPDRLVFDLDPDEGLDFDDGEEGGGAICKALLAEIGLTSFPMLSGGKGVHVVVPLDARADWPAVKDFAERFSRAHRRGRARALHRQHPQGPAQGPHLPRLAAQPARRDRGDALLRPRPRRRAGRGPDRLGRARRVSKAATTSRIRDADELLERASSKMLAGWGEAKQALPDA